MGRDCLSRARRAEHRRRHGAANVRLIPPINRNQYRGPSAGPRKGEAMSISITNTAARLQRDVPATEGRIDDALVAMSSLMTTIVTARRDIGSIPAVAGQATIHRLATAQLALVGVSGDGAIGRASCR